MRTSESRSYNADQEVHDHAMVYYPGLSRMRIYLLLRTNLVPKLLTRELIYLCSSDCLRVA